jgi:hypothetical protein
VPLKKIVVYQMGKPEPVMRKSGTVGRCCIEKADFKNDIISNSCQVLSGLVRNISNRLDQIQVLPGFG